MSRLKLNDSMMDVAIKMGEGNPGGLRVVCDLIKDQETDPDSALQGLGAVLSLDTLGLYADKIWMLYKDVCGEDLAVMKGVLRAWQLGFLTKEKLVGAVNGGDPLPLDELRELVTARLPNFKWPQPASETEVVAP
jgi:hypothetical protein